MRRFWNSQYQHVCDDARNCAATQLEKIDMLDFADLIAVNKFERRQAVDAFVMSDTLRRNRFQGKRLADEEFPVFGTIASRFADDGVNGLYKALVEKLNANNRHESLC